jgi:hypothetical protein
VEWKGGRALRTGVNERTDPNAIQIRQVAEISRPEPENGRCENVLGVGAGSEWNYDAFEVAIETRLGFFLHNVHVVRWNDLFATKI